MRAIGQPLNILLLRTASDFEKTFQALQDADVLMAVLDGYSVDDSVAAQIGIFYTLARQGDKKRQVIGILHDTRVAGWSWSGKIKPRPR